MIKKTSNYFSQFAAGSAWIAYTSGNVTSPNVATPSIKDSLALEEQRRREWRESDRTDAIMTPTVCYYAIQRPHALYMKSTQQIYTINMIVVILTHLYAMILEKKKKLVLKGCF